MRTCTPLVSLHRFQVAADTLQVTKGQISANRYQCLPDAIVAQQLSLRTRQLQILTAPSRQQNSQQLLRRQAQDRRRANLVAERLQRQQPLPLLLPRLL
jgi:hypothetical protein